MEMRWGGRLNVERVFFLTGTCHCPDDSVSKYFVAKTVED